MHRCNRNITQPLYLWGGQQQAQSPGHQQHASVPQAGVQGVQRVKDGPIPVQTHHHQYERGRVHGEELEETQQLTHDVPGVPLHCDVPDCVQWHHHKRHHQIRWCQAGDERAEVSRQAITTAPAHTDEDGQVTDGGKDKEHQGGCDTAASGHGEGGSLPWRRGGWGGGAEQGEDCGVV